MPNERDEQLGRIEVAPDIDAFFEEVVHEAIVARRVPATNAAEHYLALMLSDYARGEGGAQLDRPVTFLLRDALALKGAERFEQLRKIGDAVLYALGFFGPAMTRRGTDREYVIAVGSSAYGHASAMLELGGADSAHNVLQELARKYDRFADVLALVADNSLATGRDDASVLRLYERWLHTGSDRLAEALGAAGLWPLKRSGGLN
ncbi:MAG TPA: hypothetical protein VFB62_07385 [Polyangiaceae bacterium]|jgi:hypothetical protein|nr:hypothetical protein [Polyangiaceae bacterium]